MSFLSPIHTDGYKFVGIFAAVTALLYLIHPTLGHIGLVLTLWCAYFFRNPKRVTPIKEGLIVSPADGMVCLIKKCVPPQEYGMGEEPRFRVSIFLNVFDVHVNRVPLHGKIEKIIYHPGKFINASLDKASDDNERQTIVLAHNNTTKIAFTQIAGLIARRIRCDVVEGEEVATGQVYGLIRFGSRMDVYLPVDTHPLVIEGQRMVSGETVIADLTSAETQRVGVKH